MTKEYKCKICSGIIFVKEKKNKINEDEIKCPTCKQKYLLNVGIGYVIQVNRVYTPQSSCSASMCS